MIDLTNWIPPDSKLWWFLDKAKEWGLSDEKIKDAIVPLNSPFSSWVQSPFYEEIKCKVPLHEILKKHFNFESEINYYSDTLVASYQVNGIKYTKTFSYNRKGCLDLMKLEHDLLKFGKDQESNYV